MLIFKEFAIQFNLYLKTFIDFDKYCVKLTKSSSKFNTFKK